MRLDPLLVISAALYGLAGLALTFAGSEILEALGGRADPFEAWAVQLAGAGLLAVGWVNWVQRYAVVAGVLGRPVLLTNLVFAAVSGGASFTAWRHSASMVALVSALILGTMFVAFGARLYRRPGDSRGAVIGESLP